MNNKRRKNFRGLTLFEALIASVLLAVVVAAVSQAIVVGQMQTYDTVHRSRALSLAESMMEEIIRLPFNDPDGPSNMGPEGGETGRSAFDNIDDFHGFSLAAGNITDAAGNLYPTPYQVLSLSVTASAGSETITGLSGSISGVNVIVTVQDASGTSWSIQQFIPEA